MCHEKKTSFISGILKIFISLLRINDQWTKWRAEPTSLFSKQKLLNLLPKTVNIKTLSYIYTEGQCRQSGRNKYRLLTVENKVLLYLHLVIYFGVSQISSPSEFILSGRKYRFLTPKKIYIFTKQLLSIKEK